MRRASCLIALLVGLAVLAACSSREKTVIPSGEISADQQQTALRRKVAPLLERRNYRRALGGCRT